MSKEPVTMTVSGGGQLFQPGQVAIIGDKFYRVVSSEETLVTFGKLPWYTWIATWFSEKWLSIKMKYFY